MSAAADKGLARGPGDAGGTLVENFVDGGPRRLSSGACIFIQKCYHLSVNGKHRKTLATVFTDPVSGTIEWAAVESLLLAAGVRLIEGSGSRVRFEKDGEVGTFHRPHPGKEALRYCIKAAREFLEKIGATT